jgi:hypothetical protein
MSEVRPLREGFQSAAPPELPVEPPAPSNKLPSSTMPQPPLPSQLKSEAPIIEPPLSDLDKLRQNIAAAPTKWPFTVNLLYKPITNDKGELVNSLTFREPRASEINRVGNPVRILWDGEIIYEERKMTYIMGALCGIQPPLLDAMDPRDWNSCAWCLREFFLPDPRAWSLR